MRAIELPDHLRYDLAHTWVKADDGRAEVGITDFAACCWGEVEFVRLPAVGEDVQAGQPVAQALCADAGPCDVFSPVSGRVAAVNDVLVEDPSLAGSDPYHEGWLFRVAMSQPAELHDLVDAGAYREALESEPARLNLHALGPVFEHSVDAMFVVDPHRRIVAKNAAAEKLTGYRVEELANGCRCQHLLRCEAGGSSLHGVMCAGMQALRGIRTSGPSRISIQRKDGSRVDVSVSYSPIPLPGGEVALTLITLRPTA